MSKSRNPNPPAAAGAVTTTRLVEQREVLAIPGEPMYSPNAECGSKRAYADKETAWRASRRVQARFGDLQEAYRCSHCGLFHLGHKPPTAAQDRYILCAGCGRPWRPNVRHARDGTVIAVFTTDPTRCRRCQPTHSDALNHDHRPPTQEQDQ